MNIDFGLTATDYAQHRAGFPDSLFDQLLGRGIGLSSQTVVDLGTGTGTLARGFAARGCKVIGIDPAAPLLEQARRLSVEQGLTAEFRLGTAESTGLESESVEVVTAGQCWHWFDGPKAAREVGRILKPGGGRTDRGLIAICHFDWIPLAGNILDLTEALIRKHNPAWNMSGGHGLHPEWLRHLAEADFVDLETFSHDVYVPYTHEAWRGRIRASAGVGASLAPEQVEAFDREHAALLQEKFPEPILRVHHRVWAAVGQKI